MSRHNILLSHITNESQLHVDILLLYHSYCTVLYLNMFYHNQYYI